MPTISKDRERIENIIKKKGKKLLIKINESQKRKI